MSRLQGRFLVFSRALPRLPAWRPRHPPSAPGKILIAHSLLLGDTLMLAPLLAKIRANLPEAETTVTVRPSAMELFASRPYGIRPVAYDPRDPATVKEVVSAGPFDLALIPGDNRYAWLALAAGARWIRAFSGDRPAYKDWPIDELIDYRGVPGNWADLNADLLPGPAPPAYQTAQWPLPQRGVRGLPTGKYAVLHIGASTPLKEWPPQRWARLAEELESRGYRIVWSAGRNEEHLVRSADPQARHTDTAGRLDIAELATLVAKARLLVTLDTSISHLGKLAGTPTMTLYGPGTKVLYGESEFWKDAPFSAVMEDDIPCRNQHTLFKRELAWVQRCGRSTDECDDNICMQAISPEMVLETIEKQLHHKTPHTPPSAARQEPSNP